MKSRHILIIFILVMLLAIIASVVVVAAGVYTNGYESTRKHYIAVNDTVIKKNGGTMLAVDDSTEFTLKGAGFKASEWGEYDVKVTANSASGLTFTSGGQPCKYADIDFTEYFVIDKAGGEFVIAAGEYGVNTLLGKLYDDVIITSMPKAGAMPYIMTVTPSDGKAVQIYLDFVIEPADIELEPSGGIVAG